MSFDRGVVEADVVPTSPGLQTSFDQLDEKVDRCTRRRSAGQDDEDVVRAMDGRSGLTVSGVDGGPLACSPAGEDSEIVGNGGAIGSVAGRSLRDRPGTGA